MRKIGKRWLYISSMVCLSVNLLLLGGCQKEKEDIITLRVSNWEEYIDEGQWSDEDTIELSDGTVICPSQSMVEDFEEWFFEQYGKKVNVEYSTFGTNEELYNQMVMGDSYDVVCPSEYMIMKLMREGWLLPFSDSFFDETKEENYYSKGVSPYIKNVFDDLSINGEAMSLYSAGYMWGTLGIVYNPQVISEEEAAHWNLLLNEDYRKQITIKDSVRDAYFAANSIYNENRVCKKEFLEDINYAKNLDSIINDTKSETIREVEEILTEIKENVYSFETDSGKSDLVTGKVVANQQWSGDAVYSLDQAEEDGVILCYSAPEEATNLWFDGWCLIKEGIGENPDKRLAAEAFVNFVSRPDNVVRNMYYIGYTSVIAGGEDDTLLQYIDYCYGAEEDSSELVPYSLGYFFTGKKDKELTEELSDKYTIYAEPEQMKRQLFAQYPPEDVVKRSVVMACFSPEENERINQMWLNVRCFDCKRFFSLK